MATSSIFSNIYISGETSCRTFLDAAEASEKAAKNRTRIPVKVKELKTKDEIKAVFKKSDI